MINLSMTDSLPSALHVTEAVPQELQWQGSQQIRSRFAQRRNELKSSTEFEYNQPSRLPELLSSLLLLCKTGMLLLGPLPLERLGMS